VAPIGFGNNYLASGSGVVHLQGKKNHLKNNNKGSGVVVRGLSLESSVGFSKPIDDDIFSINIGRWVTWLRAVVIKKSA
jgi:hypothetical protein